MEMIFIDREKFEEFRDVQIRPRADWPATFSCNSWNEVWPFSSYSATPEGDRVPLQGLIPQLDEIVKIVLNFRSSGGRFFISDDGVFVRPWDEHIQIAEFIIL